jgi:outer membrane lipoprotein-sorting protein
MKLNKPYIFLLVALTTFNSFAQKQVEIPVTNPGNLMEQVNIFSQKTSTIIADFTQSKEMSFLEEKAISDGKFYFEKEKKLRWEYTEPFSYTIILNGDRIRIIDEGKTKDFDAGANRMFLDISNVMTGMVNGTLLGSDKFSTTWFEATGYYLARLVPEEAALKDYLTLIELKINKTDYSVEELKMYEKSGDFTHITFSNKKLNETVPADIFRLD